MTSYMMVKPLLHCISLYYYVDINDFISQSGWFSFPNMVLGKEAQLHLLARKSGLEYQAFVDMKKAVYVLSYRKEKVKEWRERLERL